MYYAIYSKNNILLSRLFVDLQMSGFVNDRTWNDSEYVFEEGFPKYLAINHYQEVIKNILTFFNDGCSGVPIRLWITERNYLKVLGEIINSKN